MRTFLNRFFGSGRIQGPDLMQETGRPPSDNGASSLHLVWEAPSPPLWAVRATIEIIKAPASPDLYFFALQATFTERGRRLGGAHVGLQWNRRHPGSTAINWGGYRAAALGGGVLAGTESALRSAREDPNTRDYSWRPRRPYRLTIEPGATAGWWRATVENLHTAESTVIRELDGGGDRLSGPMVWAEVFAPCDGPTVEVRWSGLEVATERDNWQRVDTVRANYQAYRDGGCTNTSSAPSGEGFAQITNVARVTRNGQILRADV